MAALLGDRVASMFATGVKGRISSTRTQHGLASAKINLIKQQNQHDLAACASGQSLQLRPYSQHVPRVLLYDYEAIKKMSKSPSPTGKQTLIDVREPHEYRAGYIPNAINIPVVSQPDALTLEPEAFEDRFGFAKPRTDNEIVFYCKAGVRSGHAAAIAQQQGYGKISEYKGSWTDWTKNGGREAT